VPAVRMTASGADPFDAGPYARLQAALTRGRPWIEHAGTRAVVLALVAWLPLLPLAAAQGLAVGDDPRTALLLDPSAYARYLVALPVLVLAEPICLPMLARIAEHFRRAGMVSAADQPRYESLIASSRRVLESRTTEISLLLLAYLATLASANAYYPADVSSWVAPIRDGERSVSLAGWWRMLVSQPLFLVLLGAWLWRIAVWARFLWRVSRLDLVLVPAHPDLAGGLQFVSNSLRAFTPIAFALGANSAGSVAEGMLVTGRTLPSYQWTFAILGVFVLVLFVAPMLVFSAPLHRARIRGSFTYGELATSLGRHLEQRWLGAGSSVDQGALSAPDFSATTDLYSIAANVRSMRLVPLDVVAILGLLAAALLPFLPLLLTVVPVSEIVRFATKLVL
jgi:hypothetical protein